MSFDINEIKAQVSEVLAYSQNTEFTPKVDKLINGWLEAKRDIIEAFGGKLIYEVSEPITFHLNEKERKERLDEFVDRVCGVYQNSSLADFLDCNGLSFYENRVNLNYEFKDNLIPAGMKLLKSFKFFESDEETLKRLQSEASMLIQEDKVEGILCFSVHPLDYLSSSENNYNWRSCHALDGEFRAGNLSYMLDKSTIVCYLKGRQILEPIPRFPDSVPWNSKKWRMLLFLSESWRAIFAGRQYPFMSESGLEIITPYLHKALKATDMLWSDWHNDVITQYNYDNGQDNTSTVRTVVLGGKYYDMFDLIQDGENSKHFNDLLRSSCYTPFYSWVRYCSLARNSKFPCGYGEHFTIGSAAPCICCENRELFSTESMLCEDCYIEFEGSDDEDIYTCECCGSRVWREDIVETADGSLICPSCAQNDCIRCNSCNELIFSSEAMWRRQVERFYCRCCYNRIVLRGEDD